MNDLKKYDEVQNILALSKRKLTKNYREDKWNVSQVKTIITRRLGVY